MHVLCKGFLTDVACGCAGGARPGQATDRNPGCTCRERYMGGPTNSVTRKELGALFDVTGTPSWRDVEGVQSATWRNYLQRLPGRAPTLCRRLGFAGAKLCAQGHASRIVLHAGLVCSPSTASCQRLSVLCSWKVGDVMGAEHVQAMERAHWTC